MTRRRRTSPALRAWQSVGVCAALVAAGYALSWAGWLLVAVAAAVGHVLGGGR